MDEHIWLAEQFEERRPRMRAIAYRMLGSSSEADDAVQEAWLHLSRSDTHSIMNLGGWLTTVVARVCLDMLRARGARREESLEARGAAPMVGGAAGDPEQEALLADSLGLALLVVLDSLRPDERLAFVLHDIFAVPFEEIAPMVERSPSAARQLASRARRRVRGAAAADVDHDRQRAVVAAFLAAAREGDFEGLLALLAPDAVLRSDVAAVATGAAPELRGADAVARQFAGRARAAQLALVQGEAGLVWASGRQPRVVFSFTLAQGAIVAIELIADPARLGQLDIVLLGS